jgi:hypothetical protein
MKRNKKDVEYLRAKRKVYPIRDLGYIRHLHLLEVRREINNKDQEVD